MRVLDLFSGTGSSTQAFEDRGHDVWRIELDPSFPADQHLDVMDLTRRDLPGTWDFIWASPPCTCFSLAAISHHFSYENGVHSPRHEGAQKALDLVAHTRRLIEEIGPLAAVMENPRATLRKMSVVEGLDRETVWYCTYGDHAAKPTDLWLFNVARRFYFNPPCRNGNPECHHEAAPRGSKTGTQGKKGSKDRSRVPYGLSESLCIQMEQVIEGRFSPGRLAS